MLGRLRNAKLIWPTLAALAGLAVLVGLGTWQLERKRWKEDLLAKMAARVGADPVPMARLGDPAAPGADIEYRHVTVVGRFHHDRERYLYQPGPGGLGWHVYTPLQTAPGRILWVNRGLVPDTAKDPAKRSAGQVVGEIQVQGLLRKAPAKALFAPQNDPRGNLWYWPDVAALTISAFPPGTVMVLPLVLEVDAKPLPPGGLPAGGVTRINLPNRHLEYAVTWFGLAATLVGVYFAFAATRLRASGAP
jgi:surfeit locus 1 family protein